MKFHMHITTMYTVIIGLLVCSEGMAGLVDHHDGISGNLNQSPSSIYGNKKQNKRHALGLGSTTTAGFKIFDYSSGLLDASDISSTSVQRTSEVSNKSDVCKLKFVGRDAHKFRQLVVSDGINFVYLKLVTYGPVKLEGSSETIDESEWVWTFTDTTGGYMFLRFPVEFEIWSLGLLSQTTKALIIHLSRSSGNCTSLVVGNQNDDLVVSTALMEIATSLLINMETNQTYERMRFCYKTRNYIESSFLRQLCEHLVCPIPTVQYQCCKNYYRVTLGKRQVICGKDLNIYEMFLWLLPMIIGLTLFFYCPLLLMYIFYFATPENCSLQARTVDQLCQRFVFLDNSYPVTVYNTLFSFLKNLTKNSSICKSRLLRMSFPCLSLAIIGIQVTLDHFYLRSYVLSAIRKKAPMGFRSMLGGIGMSSTNFLPYMGGPVIALCVYLFAFLLLLATPRSLAEVLNRGIDESVDSLDSINVIKKFGIVKIHTWCSYGRIYHVLLGKMFILINIRYWKYVLSFQKRRWNLLCQNRLCLATFPFYVIYCSLEIVFRVLLFNGIPVFSFGAIAVRAYILTLKKFLQINCNNLWSALLLVVPSICVTLVVMYSALIFCAIFLDSSIFITRIIMFTYSGIVVHPKSSYSYLILFLTYLFYTMVLFRDFANYYRRLLKDGIKIVCSAQKDQEENHLSQLVIKQNGVKGLNILFYDHLIEKVRPRRVQLFCLLIRLMCILYFISFSICLLQKTTSMKDLDIFVQLCTALFACAVPQIITVCSNVAKKKQKSRKQKDAIRLVLYEFLATEASVAGLYSWN